MFWFFLFKPQTAYEMRISDWSSDVCSSDLALPAQAAVTFTADPKQAGPFAVPRGAQVAAQGPDGQLIFETQAPMGLVATPLAMVIAFDGARYVELTAEHAALDTEVSPFGPSPTTGAAFLLGFARAPENGAAAVFPEEIRLHLFRTPAFGGPPD